MKSTILWLAAAFSLFFSNGLQAQDEEYKHTISATAGLNIFQIIGLIDELDDANSSGFSSHGTASYGVTYDYQLLKWLSVGGGVAFNAFSLDADYIELTRDDGSFYAGFIDLNISRTNIAVRPLFHYGSARVDMYSGLRLGVNVFTTSLKSSEPLLVGDVSTLLSGSGAGLGVQLIPFGLRGYVTPNFGIGFEMGLGGPHYAALQLNYRM